MLKKTAMQFCTASASKDEPAAKIVKFTKELQSCIAGLGEDFEDEALKTKIKEVNKQLQTLLAGLEEDKDDKSQEGIFTLASSAQSILTDAIKARDTQIQTLRASMPAEIASAIEAKVKGGEYVLKADHEKAISDATAAATTAARTAALGEIKVISGRRAQLATASIPAPADDTLLAGDDTAFKAKQDTAAKRVEELKRFKLENDRVLTLAWNTDEKAYQDSLNLMTKAFEAAGKPAAGANGFANRDGAGTTAAKPKIGLC